MKINPNILILYPNKGAKKGQPSYERINSFKNFYEKEGFNVVIDKTPSNLLELIRIILLVKKNIDYIFLSMPPFKNWLLFLFFKNKVVLDIRDGWSIAMETGYGGTVKPRKLKSKIARFIEKYALKRAYKVITCTTGLVHYFKSISSKNIIFIPNGYSEDSYKIVDSLCKKQRVDNKKYFVCTGKFSEYGEDKVKRLIHRITEFTSDEVVLKLIGCDYYCNSWVIDYVKQFNNVEVSFLERMDKKEMYEEILNSDYGVAIVRNPNYELGTKVYDYILCDIPIFNYFDKPNSFTDYFEGFLNDDYNRLRKKEVFSRIYSINKAKNEL